MSRSLTFLCFLMGLIPLCLTTYIFQDVTPFWDSAWYARCIIEIGFVSPSFPLPPYPAKSQCGLALDPIVILAYMIPLWLSYFGIGGGIAALYAGNLALLVVYLYSMLVIIRRSILKKSATFASYLFPLLLCASDPLILTYALVISPDVAKTAFCVTYVAAMLSGHPFVAAGIGILTLFAKPTAVPIFTLLGSVTLVFISLKHTGPFRAKLNFFTARFLLAVLLPLLAYGSGIYFLKASYGAQSLKSLCWSRPDSVFELFLTFDFSSPTVINYLFNSFLLNFHWVESLLLIVCAALGAFRWIFGYRAATSDWTTARSYFSLSILYLLVTIYTTTRCQHFNNPKYVLVTVPFFHLAFIYSTYFAGMRPFMRNTLFAVLITLQSASSVLTIDPVSKWFYGTFQFGNTPLLAMTSRTGECCGYGRDQLSYNLQYLKIDQITAQIIKEVPGTKESPIVLNDQAMFHLLGHMTAKNDRCLTKRQIDCTSGLEVLNDESVASRRPQTFTYIDYPFLHRRIGSMNFYTDYDLQSTKRFSSGQYFIDTYQFRRKPHLE